MLKILIEIIGIVIMVMIMTLSVSLLHLLGVTGNWMLLGIVPCVILAFGTYQWIAGNRE